MIDLSNALLSKALGAVLCASVGLTATQALAQSDWPSEPIRLIIPAGSGGGADRNARTLQPYLEQELGVPIAAENMPGANFTIGARAVAKAGPSCDTMMAIYEPTLLTMGISEANLPFTYDDFYPLGGIFAEPFALFVPNESPIKDWSDLVQKIKDNPGDVRVGITSWFDVTTVHLLELENILGAKLNIIRYDSGSKARAALLAGETDFGYHILFGSQGVWDSTRTLAYFTATGLEPSSDISQFVDNAPKLQDLVDGKLTDTVLTFSLYVTSGCHSENPEHYNRLLDALRKALQNPAYQEKLAEANMQPALIGVLGDDFFKVYQTLRPTLEGAMTDLVLPQLNR